MPVTITLQQLPAGYCMEAARPGEEFPLQVTGMTTSADGSFFLERLEGIPSMLLEQVGSQRDMRLSQIDHMLAIIHRDRRATIYVNELPIRALTRLAHPVELGTAVYKDDVVDVEALDIGNVDIPTDTGVVFVLSVGWRKGLFYDLGPLNAKLSLSRSFDVRSLFGDMYARLLFHERFEIPDENWEAMFRSRWFPFSGLKTDTIGKMLGHLRSGFDVDELTSDIVAEVTATLDAWLQSWREHPAFQGHIPFLEQAVTDFRQGRHTQCVHVLYPRIEGILRSFHAATSGLSTSRPTQQVLAEAAVVTVSQRQYCPLLPHRFERYLSEVYFGNFKPGDSDTSLSRNSLAHGVASGEQFNAKSAVMALLVVHQLFHCCRIAPRPEII
jgi:hypothetical protein